MYLSKAERQEIMASYGYGDSVEINHYEVGPDTWIYLFEYKYESDRLEFILQREIPVKDNSSREKTAGTLLFEYTD